MQYVIRDSKIIFPMGSRPVPSIEEMQQGIIALGDLIDRFENDENITNYNKRCGEEFDMEMRRIEKKVIDRRRMGFIYFIQDSHGYIKIGKTVDIKSRLQKYISENSGEIKMIKYIKSEDYTSEEIKFHKMFENKRHKGERFKLDKKDIDFILSLE